MGIFLSDGGKSILIQTLNLLENYSTFNNKNWYPWDGTSGPFNEWIVFDWTPVNQFDITSLIVH